VNSSSKKADIVEACRTVGVDHIDSGDTKGQLLRKLREKRDTDGSRPDVLWATPTGADLMCFGKHSNSTYEEVYKSDKQYAKWCMMTAKQEPFCSKELRRFTQWVQIENGQTPTPAPHLPTYVTPSSSGKQRVAEDGEQTDQNDDLPKMMFNLRHISSDCLHLVMMGRMMERINDLEAKDNDTSSTGSFDVVSKP
jgi:hypothetical protein